MSTEAPLLSRMARLFAARGGLYCVSALIAGVFGIAALSALAQLEFGGTVDGRLDSVTAWHSMTVTNQLIFIFGLLFGLWAPVLIAARGACRIAMNQITGQPLSLGTVLADMFRFVPAALVYSLLIGLPVSLGAAMIFLPGILAASFCALVIPVSIGETAGIFTTLRRGISLSERVFGRLFLVTMASAAILFMVVMLRVYGLDQFLSGSGPALFAARFGITYVPAIFVLLLANISFTLLYLEARGADEPPPTPPLSEALLAEKRDWQKTKLQKIGLFETSRRPKIEWIRS